MNLVYNFSTRCHHHISSEVVYIELPMKVELTYSLPVSPGGQTPHWTPRLPMVHSTPGKQGPSSHLISLQPSRVPSPSEGIQNYNLCTSGKLVKYNLGTQKE